MHTNRLAGEKSPYLLQHAHNPVDWYPWGEEAFARALAEDRPVFLSIGYSTCHWCHVMERESFEDEAIAAILNRHFVSIKVDREERPDVDRIYMLFVQATTGGGGWPMSVWLTPDRKPFFGGTYFPPDSRYGRPGFAQVLEHLAEAWTNERERIVESGESVIAELRRMAEVSSGTRHVLDASVLDSGFQAFRRMYDTRHGGFGSAPKFPRPSVLNFLLRYSRRRRNAEALAMVLQTLEAMAHGGMNDQLGGGFHRYSVDERWHVPHFEKMLYDQAQLATAYVEAYQVSGREEFAQVARATLEYVLRDMLDDEGGFYSAEDADSAPDAARPEEKAEGAFYVWRRGEIEEALGGETAAWFCFRYGVEEGGNAANDPHGEFTGKNILYQARSIEETAAHFGVEPEGVRSALKPAVAALLELRARRPRPYRDDKILTAWNGLAISAFARAGAALGEARYVTAARRAAEFLLGRMYDPATGILLRRFRAGEAAVPGFLDDYAMLGQALIDLYEADFHVAHLERAAELTGHMIARFHDGEHGAFFSTAEGAADLVVRIKEDYDGAEPSGNSIAALNLLRLAEYTGREEWRELGLGTLQAFGPRLLGTPAAIPQTMAALAFHLSPPREIVLAGKADSPELREMFETLQHAFVPERVVLALAVDGARERFAAWIPRLEAMRPEDGRATAWVCEEYVCRQPVTGVEEFRKLLQ